MGLARITRGGARACVIGALALAVTFVRHDDVRAAPAPAAALVLAADRDDDDADGKADAEAEVVPPLARVDAVPLDKAFVGWEIHAVGGAEHARMLAPNGRVVPWDRPAPKGALLQGLTAGAVQLVAARGAAHHPIAVEVRTIGFVDGKQRRVDTAKDHASIERTPPARIEGAPDAAYDDPDALRLWVEVPEGRAAAAPRLAVESVSASGGSIDVLAQVALAPAHCAKDRGDVRCFASAPLRFVMDDVDRTHPLVSGRSLRAEVGGAIVVREAGKKLQAIRVLGPRDTAAGPIRRLRATIRPFVLRVTPGGTPAIGSNDAGAVTALRAELALASSIWGQCGVTFGPTSQIDVHIVNPPPPYLLAIGDDAGLAATGGELSLRADGHPVTISMARGALPDRVASELSRALEKVGLTATISPNARIAPGAGGSVDLLVSRRKDGRLVALEPLSLGARLTTDATLAVRIGSVDLSDGLQHFGDMDSVAGTLEERTLLKSIDDGDPQTVEVIIVPSFTGGGRIGESFIASDLSSLRNAVLLDRAGVRARRSSLTLAHELGHVLLDMPGHPDDYGLDTPTLLMDSDASDASPFGPRRLTLDECARVVRQAGPKARVPLLADWPIGALAYPALISRSAP